MHKMHTNLLLLLQYCALNYSSCWSVILLFLSNSSFPITQPSYRGTVWCAVGEVGIFGTFILKSHVYIGKPRTYRRVIPAVLQEMLQDSLGGVWKQDQKGVIYAV